jgi:hypothetical protein
MARQKQVYNQEFLTPLAFFALPQATMLTSSMGITPLVHVHVEHHPPKSSVSTHHALLESNNTANQSKYKEASQQWQPQLQIVHAPAVFHEYTSMPISQVAQTVET